MAIGKKNGNNTVNGAKETVTCFGCNHPSSCCGCAHLVLANFLFGIGLLTLLFAWIAESESQRIFGITSDHLFFNSIAFMIAGVFFKRKF